MPYVRTRHQSTGGTLTRLINTCTRVRAPPPDVHHVNHHDDRPLSPRSTTTTHHADRVHHITIATIISPTTPTRSTNAFPLRPRHHTHCGPFSPTPARLAMRAHAHITAWARTCAYTHCHTHTHTSTRSPTTKAPGARRHRAESQAGGAATALAGRARPRPGRGGPNRDRLTDVEACLRCGPQRSRVRVPTRGGTACTLTTN